MTDVVTHLSQSPVSRVRVELQGTVQGVGFRPFVCRLARALDLVGWIKNAAASVIIEAEGPVPVLNRFLDRLQSDKPPHAHFDRFETRFLDEHGYTGFQIYPSEDQGPEDVHVLPDLATCPACLTELFTVGDRRHLYPFINCTDCGPRYSILRSYPYDRCNTTMSSFDMCEACSSEYHDPANRRYHAQPNACPVCGPQIAWWDEKGRPLSERQDALHDASEAILAGLVVAVKGLGGFHLVVDARSVKAVERLRLRKHRPHKPFALMFPTLEEIKRAYDVSREEERLLCSAAAPIVLLMKKASTPVCETAAPGCAYHGVFLPYTPLHHVLLHLLGSPIVATSGNSVDEPICIDEHKALKHLSGIADRFLVHNRAIARPVDDSVVRLVAGRKLVLRSARGLAPYSISIKQSAAPTLAVGGHLKNTIAIAKGHYIYVTPHIGDLETTAALDHFMRAVRDTEAFYRFKPKFVAADPHPDYATSPYSAGREGDLNYVQHHHAHVASCMAENEMEGEVLGVSWDGTGYGLDNSVWGGEFLLANYRTFERVGHLSPFPLLGGSKAVLEPRRVGLSVLAKILGDKAFQQPFGQTFNAFDRKELSVLKKMLEGGLNTPFTTSAGRLFDAVASILGLVQVCTYEGEAANRLEHLTIGIQSNQSYPLAVDDLDRSSKRPILVDWKPLIIGMLLDLHSGIADELISVKFHNTLAEVIVIMAQEIDCPRVVLSGGCFQNRYLLERTVSRLREDGFVPYWHQRVPPNDGGLSVGQAMVAVHQKRGNKHVLSHSR